MKNRVLIGVIVVLTLVIAFEGVYIFTHWDKEAEPEESYTNNTIEDENDSGDNTNEDVEDYVKLIDTKEDGNQIVQEYEMVLNGEYQEFEVEFNIVEENDMSGYWTITSLFDDVYLFSVYYDNSDLMVQDYVEYVEKYFNENNFIIFPGIDGINYLIIQSYAFPPAGGVGIDYNIFNQNWDYIGNLSVIYQGQGVILEDESVWYSDNLNIDTIQDYNKIRSKIEGDKIYNLYYICDYMEERVYTINNNKLEYEVINQYKILEASGAAC